MVHVDLGSQSLRRPADSYTTDQCPLFREPGPLGRRTRLGVTPAVPCCAGIPTVVESGLKVVPRGRDQRDLTGLTLNDLKQFVLIVVRRRQAKQTTTVNAVHGKKAKDTKQSHPLTSRSLIALTISCSAVTPS